MNLNKGEKRKEIKEQRGVEVKVENIRRDWISGGGFGFK